MARQFWPVFWGMVASAFWVVFLILFPSLFVIAPPRPTALSTWEHISLVATRFGVPVAVGAILGTTIYHFIAWRRAYGHIVVRRRDWRVTRALLPGSIIVVALSLLIVLLTVYVPPGAEWRKILVENPGGIFAAVTGVLSVAGIYLTFQQVLDVRNTIVAFGDYVHRVAALIDDTHPGDYIRMMVHTPATGCLVLRRSAWIELAEKLQREETCDISLTCLTDQWMSAWFDSYKQGLEGESLLKMERRISEGLRVSDVIKMEIRAKKGRRRNGNVDVLEASWTDLPPYYLIANNRQAIVAVPFFLPEPDKNIHALNVHHRPVTMIGFETRDAHIVDSVLHEIETRRSAIAKGLAQAGQATLPRTTGESP